MRVANLTRGTDIAASIRVATSMRDRMVGLLNTSAADLGDGLLIEHTPSIHMFFMRYAIDAVFVGADGRVTRTVPALQPWRVVWWARGARDCLELPVGRIAQSRTAVGDEIEVTAAAPSKPTVHGR